MKCFVAGSINDRLKLLPLRPVTAAEVPTRGRAALFLLLDAYEYARDVQCGAWDFAVEIKELRKTGCTSSELRWLVRKGIVYCAVEIESATGLQRIFEKHGCLVFYKRSCFVLTDTGATLTRSLIGQKSEIGRMSAVARGTDETLPDHPLPKWDRDRQELRLGTLIVKRFKVPATNQERILAAFEEEDWPVRIDDPLPPHPHRPSKRRLHDTINALNRAQIRHLIRFRGDGKGKGVLWDLPGVNGNGAATIAFTSQS